MCVGHMCPAGNVRINMNKFFLLAFFLVAFDIKRNGKIKIYFTFVYFIYKE